MNELHMLEPDDTERSELLSTIKFPKSYKRKTTRTHQNNGNNNHKYNGS